jgi:hypothetical protein
MSTPQSESWAADQLAKSSFFHKKLHEWALLDVAETLEQIQGEKLAWDIAELGISEIAWHKIIHRGIKPVRVFAHPDVLTNVARSTSYYRMLAMVSQKSMSRVGLPTQNYETNTQPPQTQAESLARHLNAIISILIESDDQLNPREFDLWRGMAAGTQAQGSWQNAKGQKTELLIQTLIRRSVQAQNLQTQVEASGQQINLKNGLTLIFADEPDIAVYRQGQLIAAVEVKGGIDTAGVLERIGAAIKSLHRAKTENPQATTILIMPAVSLTPQALLDLQANQSTINHHLTVESILENDTERKTFFEQLHLIPPSKK